MLPVTAFAAILMTVGYTRISRALIGRRRAVQIAVGDGGDDTLTRMRAAQSNLFEYGVLFVGLIALCELNGVPWWWLATLVAAFAAGRGALAYGLLVSEPDATRGPKRFRWRVRGMIATLSVIPLTGATLAGALLYGVLA